VDVAGLFDSKEPRFASANLVYPRYCSSDAWAGDAVSSWSPDFAFRGAQIAHAVFRDLAARHGLGALPNTQVLYGGCSAGARGALFNGDSIHALLGSLLGPQLSRFGVLFDSGFWIDVQPYDTALPSLALITQQAVAMAGMGAAAAPACAAAYPGAELWKCFFGFYALRFLQAPFYANQFLYDQYQLEKDGIPGRPKDDGVAYAEVFRGLTESGLRAAFDAQPGSAASLPGCHKHCNTLTGNTWGTILTGGATLEEGVTEWFFDDAFSHRWLLETCEGWNCGLTCPAAHAPPPPAGDASLSIAVADGAPSIVLDAHYLGFNIDTGSLYGGMDLGDRVFAQLVRNLAPAQLRFGGSAADSLWYIPDATQPKGPTPDPLAPNFEAASQPGYTGYLPQVTQLSDAMMASVAAFAADVGMELLFNLNSVDFRTPSNGFDISRNTSALLDMVAARQLTVSRWQLGNEPDIYHKHFDPFTVTGAQVGADLRALQAELGARGLSTAVTGPSLATYSDPLVTDFLAAWGGAAGGPLDFTVHSYPLGGPTYAPDAKKPTCSDSVFRNLTKAGPLLGRYLDKFVAAVAAHGAPAATRLVLEEVASISLGGCIGFSDRFASSFSYLVAMGTTAQHGFRQLNRQDLAGLSFTNKPSQYALLGQPGWVSGAGLISDDSPNPDYWLSVLWPRLMGTRVLASSASLKGAEEGSLKTFVWCAAPGAAEAGPGAVTLAFANSGDEGVVLTGLAGAEGAYKLHPRAEFVLTAAAITDHAVFLNGERLRANPDGTLPKELDPPRGRLVLDEELIILPPLSVGFVVLPGANAAACR